MALTDPTAQQQPPDAQAPPEPGAGLDDVGALIDELGNCIKVNGLKSASTDTAADAKDFAQAGLFAAQALAALVPYQDPGAPNAPGDNIAKKGD